MHNNSTQYLDIDSDISHRTLFKTGDISVWHEPCQDGGGSTFRQDYIQVLQRRYPGKLFENCFEWCINANGLQISDAFHYRDDFNFYFLEVKHKEVLDDFS